MNETSVAEASSETASKAPVDIVVASGKTYWWCACGRSKDQPFCDGSHKGTQFTPMKYVAAESGTQSFCVCKQTRTPPLCDSGNKLCCKYQPSA